MFSLRPLDRRHHIFLLAFAFLVFASARADAAKVESQRGDVRVLQAARSAEDDFVVQCAATQGMWMTDDGDAGGVLKLALERFEPARAAEKIDVAERLRIHAIFTRMRSPSTRTSCVMIFNSRFPGQTPLEISTDQRCHGQTISSPMMSPSPSGPPRCGHVLSLAKNPLDV